jgi:CBS domain-containing protein
MAIGDYCRRDVRTVGIGETLRAAARKMEAEGVGCLVALEGTRPRGVLTDRDVMLRVLRDGLDADATGVESALTEDPVTVNESSSLRVAAIVMRRRGLRRLPVVDSKGQLVGLIARDDLLGVVSRELVDVAAAVAAQTPGAGAARGE